MLMDCCYVINVIVYIILLSLLKAIHGCIVPPNHLTIADVVDSASTLVGVLRVHNFIVTEIVFCLRNAFQI